MAIPLMERPPARPMRPEPVKEGGRWLVGMGAALLVLGVAALVLAEETTLFTVAAIGVFAIIAAVLQSAFAFTAARWAGFGLHALLSGLYAIVGIYLVRNPVAGTAALTMGLGLLFAVGGVFRVAASASRRFPGWGWSFSSGLITAAFGVYVLAVLPAAEFR